MVLVKPLSTPMAASTTLSCFEGSTIMDTTLYRSTVGSLQYLSLIRPDVSFVVNKVSQFMQDPRNTHWSAVKCIMCYLKSTISHTFCIHRNSSKQLTAFSDSDWASCPDDKRSMSGYCVLGKNILSRSSKKQPTLSRSSTEAEYKAIANASAELVWIQTLLGELGQEQLTNILAKPLTSARFILLKSNLNIQLPTSSLPTSSLRGRIGSNDLSTSDQAKVIELD
ncbi:uncharacterized mitochondrial protein AtMg00810-like [Alnus glutinosa]|uniref:uncharacterized mitochondrial protein AtMg00810-like n=1 Tax=Alnus glutinosa TaxID=3517 RepID=UPI002D76ADFC|nr:uncharacterized mitochondrial protein AtMg00810-like [Alnus glutinosa]